MKNVTCSKCGSVYELTSTKIMFRDKDSLSCDVCNQVIHQWNEAKIWDARLVERKENHIAAD